MKTIIKCLAGVLMVSVFIGCGGSSDSPEPSQSSWDEMVWDQDSWE